MVPPGRSWLTGLLTLVAACRFDFDRVSTSAADGGVARDSPAAHGDGAGDAGVAPGPFGRLAEVSELSTVAGEDDPTLTGDLLEIYYDTWRSGDLDIWRATRTSPTLPFEGAERVAELSSVALDSTPEISPDGLMIFLSRTLPDGTVDLLWSTRPARGSAWSMPVVVSELNSPAEDAGAAVTADLGTLFLFSDRAGNFDLYRSSHDGAGWSPPALLTELADPAYDADPCPALDGGLLLFASDRDGDFDLYAVERGDDGAFAGPTPLSELNSSAEERDPWISPDGRVIFFESFKSGTAHLYTAMR